MIKNQGSSTVQNFSDNQSHFLDYKGFHNDGLNISGFVSFGDNLFTVTGALK
jgi:hypothetical protein